MNLRPPRRTLGYTFRVTIQIAEQWVLSDMTPAFRHLELEPSGRVAPQHVADLVAQFGLENFVGLQLQQMRGNIRCILRSPVLSGSFADDLKVASSGLRIAIEEL